MRKIVLIGAGNVELTRRILSDLFSVAELHRELHIALDDTDAERLGIAAAIARSLNRETDAGAVIEVSRDRRTPSTAPTS